MSFEPAGKPIDATLWKPSKELTGLALRRCSWVNCDPINEIADTDEWLSAIIVSAYYQGLADGVKHMAKKSR